MKRKNIAVVVTGYDWEYETRIIDGICESCMRDDINVLVFASLVRKPPLNFDKVLSNDIIRGETEIFNLMNYDVLDAVLILGDNLVDTDWVARIADRAKAKGLPVININDKLREIDHNIIADNREAMVYVMRHLIQVHGTKKINFIGGFKGNVQTEERLAAYKKVLAENNIPYEEDRVAYGEFWTKAGECTKEFLSRPELPEAIVCASDAMAFFAIDEILKQGLRVPEDIIVTGFDGIADCDIHTPTLTSVRVAYRTMGIKAVELVKKMWLGEKVDRIVYVESELLLHESCGCEVKEDKVSTYNEDNEKYNSFKYFNSMLLDMNSACADANNSVELYATAREGADAFGFEKFFINICNDLENSNNIIENVEDESSKRYGLTDRCITMYAHRNEVPVGYEFDTAEMIPIDLLSGEKPVMVAFSSLYFKDKYIGYLAYQPRKTHGYMGSMFHSWVLQFSNYIGGYYIRKELQIVVNKLESLYAMDQLTGLYNRRGREKNSFIIDEAKRDNDYMTVMVCDVDGLKPINDAYGHEGGDVAIKKVAEAILKCTPDDAVCARTGGDEFLAFFKHKEPINAKDIVRKINNYLIEFNDNSGLPFKADCSCGFVSERMNSDSSFDTMLAMADEEMYKSKRKRKTLRE